MAREFHYKLFYNHPGKEERLVKERFHGCREVAFDTFYNCGNASEIEVQLFQKPSLQTKEICERLGVKWAEIEGKKIEWGKAITQPAYILSGNDDTIFLAFYWCVLADRIESYTGAVKGSFADRLKEWIPDEYYSGTKRLWAELTESNRYPTWSDMKKANLCPVWWAEKYWWDYSGYEEDN